MEGWPIRFSEPPNKLVDISLREARGRVLGRIRKANHHYRSRRRHRRRRQACPQALGCGTCSRRSWNRTPLRHTLHSSSRPSALRPSSWRTCAWQCANMSASANRPKRPSFSSQDAQPFTLSERVQRARSSCFSSGILLDFCRVHRASDGHCRQARHAQMAARHRTKHYPACARACPQSPLEHHTLPWESAPPMRP